MKKFLIILLSVAMAAGIAGCGGSSPDESGGDNPENPPVQEDANAFKVNLTCDGQKFTETEGMSAQWIDEETGALYTSEFEDDAANRNGLDGNYTVTLLNVPDGYTYNPNIYSADNENKKTEVELYKINAITGTGKDSLSDPVKISAIGAYRITLTERGQEVFCRYSPRSTGIFAIESILDVTADEVNPRIDVYVGNSAWMPSKPNYSIDGGGASSVYTKNFKYEVSVNNLGPSYTFSVKCDSRIDYPVNIDFLIKHNGEVSNERVSNKVIIPEEQFKPTPDYDGYRYVPYIGYNQKDRFRFDSSLVAYWDPADGGDGYYHLLKNGEIDKDTIIYANITSNGLFVDFTNPLVNFSFNGKNYYYLIRGYSNYLETIGGKDKIPAEVLDKIEAINCESYIDYANKDGRYAVTKELKEFLQAFSGYSSYFYDGYGWCENNDEVDSFYSGFDAAEEDMWLFACGYYKR